MHKALHPRDDVDRLHVSRKERGRGLASIEDSVDASIQRLKDYVQKYDGRLITAIRNDTDNTMDNRMTITKKQKWGGKQLYVRFKRLINNILHDKTWTWLRKGNFKRETESLLIAAQNKKVIHWKMCKKFKFNHTTKCYMHNPAPVLENNIQTPMGLGRTQGSPNLGQKTRFNNNKQKKETLQNCRLCCPG